MTDFRCPVSCLAGVSEVWGGEYKIPLQVSGNPRILDIGANCGAFTLLALKTWPEATIVAFEPNPEIFPYLVGNTTSPNVRHINAAVGDPSRNQFHHGIESPLCGGMYDVGNQKSESITVPVFDARDLPEAEIVKIDAEGAEAYIVEHMPHLPQILMLEWHSDDNRQRIEKVLDGKMVLIGAKFHTAGLGVAKYLKL